MPAQRILETSSTFNTTRYSRVHNSRLPHSTSPSFCPVVHPPAVADVNDYYEDDDLDQSSDDSESPRKEGVFDGYDADDVTQRRSNAAEEGVLRRLTDQLDSYKLVPGPLGGGRDYRVLALDGLDNRTRRTDDCRGGREQRQTGTSVKDETGGRTFIEVDRQYRIRDDERRLMDEQTGEEEEEEDGENDEEEEEESITPHSLDSVGYTRRTMAGNPFRGGDGRGSVGGVGSRAGEESMGGRRTGGMLVVNSFTSDRPLNSRRESVSAEPTTTTSTTAANYYNDKREIRPPTTLQHRADAWPSATSSSLNERSLRMTSSTEPEVHQLMTSSCRPETKAAFTPSYNHNVTPLVTSSSATNIRYSRTSLPETQPPGTPAYKSEVRHSMMSSYKPEVRPSVTSERHSMTPSYRQNTRSSVADVVFSLKRLPPTSQDFKTRRSSVVDIRIRKQPVCNTNSYRDDVTAARDDGRERRVSYPRRGTDATGGGCVASVYAGSPGGRQQLAGHSGGDAHTRQPLGMTRDEILCGGAVRQSQYVTNVNDLESVRTTESGQTEGSEKGAERRESRVVYNENRFGPESSGTDFVNKQDDDRYCMPTEIAKTTRIDATDSLSPFRNRTCSMRNHELSRNDDDFECVPTGSRAPSLFGGAVSSKRGFETISEISRSSCSSSREALERMSRDLPSPRSSALTCPDIIRTEPSPLVVASSSSSQYPSAHRHPHFPLDEHADVMTLTGGSQHPRMSVCESSRGVRGWCGQLKHRREYAALRRLALLLQDNRLETGSAETRQKLRRLNRRRLSSEEERCRLLKGALNVLFVSTGVLLLVAVIVVIIYTSLELTDKRLTPDKDKKWQSVTSSDSAVVYEELTDDLSQGQHVGVSPEFSLQTTVTTPHVYTIDLPKGRSTSVTQSLDVTNVYSVDEVIASRQGGDQSLPETVERCYWIPIIHLNEDVRSVRMGRLCFKVRASIDDISPVDDISTVDDIDDFETNDTSYDSRHDTRDKLDTHSKIRHDTQDHNTRDSTRTRDKTRDITNDDRRDHDTSLDGAFHKMRDVTHDDAGRDIRDSKRDKKRGSVYEGRRDSRLETRDEKREEIRDDLRSKSREKAREKTREKTRDTRT